MNNAPSTDAWLEAATRNVGGAGAQTGEGSGSGTSGLADEKESETGVQDQMDEVLQGEQGETEHTGSDNLQTGYGENDPPHVGDGQERYLPDRGDVDESSRVIGGVRGASGGIEGSNLEVIVRERRKLDGLIDWLNLNREEWNNDPAKALAFRAREDKAIRAACILDAREKDYERAMGLSPDAMGRLLEMYNLVEDRG